MMQKTHLAVGLGVALYFLPHVKNPFIFIPVVLLASVFPDIDTGFSSIGRKKIFKPVQMVSEHRGFVHSYTLCILVSLLFALFLPVLALPFFLGYSFHLLLDSFTKGGIRPFWPMKKSSSGVVRTGGKFEKVFFFSVVFLDFILLFRLFV